MTFSNLLDSFGDLDWLAIIVAAVAVFVLGWLWYGPLFGKTVGMAGEKPNAASIVQGLVLFFLFSMGIAYVVTGLHVMFQNPASFETLIVSSFVVAFFLIGMALFSSVVWEGRTNKRWFIDFAFWFVAAIVSSYIQDLMA